MDHFAQSKGDDDLFDDDFIPVDTTNVSEEVESIATEVQVITLEPAVNSITSNTQISRDRGARGPRARGQGPRVGGADRAHSRSQNPSHSVLTHASEPTPPIDPPVSSAEDTTLDAAESTSELHKPAVDSPSIDDQIQGTQAETSAPIRPPAVRGDRTATGGVKKPKLTEEELTAKLAAAKTRSENLSAAHARAEADAATFEEFERAAAQKRTKGIANRRLMEGEREKNRSRKMAVMGGREWDAPKNEEARRGNFEDGGRGDFATDRKERYRATRNEAADGDLSQYQWKDDKGQSRGNGRRRGRGNSQGGPGRGGKQRQDDLVRPTMAVEADFPSLPGITRVKDQYPVSTRPDQSSDGQEAISPIVGAGSWADQVEISQAAQGHHW